MLRAQIGDDLVLAALEGAVSEPPSDSLFVSNDKLAEAIAAHPSFQGRQAYACGRQLMLHSPYNSFSCRHLLRAGKTPAEALVWLHSIYAAREAAVLYMAELRGVEVPGPIEFSNGVRLVADLDELPPSTLRDRVTSEYVFDAHKLEFPRHNPVAAIFRVSGPITETFDFERPNAISDVVLGLVLASEGAPTLGVQWEQFENPDLELARFGSTQWMPPLAEN